MSQKKELKIISSTNVEVREINWLWYPFIPRGKVTILQGDPGEGKSTFMLTLAAYLTRGEALPYTDCGEEGKHLPCDIEDAYGRGYITFKFVVAEE